MTVIIITGTPCTGKTTLAKQIAKRFGYEHIDVNALIKKEKLYEGYDRKRKTYIVNTKKLNNFLIRKIKKARKEQKNLIIDSHLSHYLSPKYVNLCIVTKCDLKELKKRLKKRNYRKEKIEENLQCEIMDVCLHEAEERGHTVKVLCNVPHRFSITDTRFPKDLVDILSFQQG